MQEIVDKILSKKGSRPAQLVDLEQMSGAGDAFMLRRIIRKDHGVEFSISRRDLASALALDILAVSAEELAAQINEGRPWIPALLDKHGLCEQSAAASKLQLSPLSLIDSKTFSGGRMLITGSPCQRGVASETFKLALRFDDDLAAEQLFLLEAAVVSKSIAEGLSALREGLIATPSAIRAIARNNMEIHAMLESHDIEQAATMSSGGRKRRPAL